MNRLVVNPNRPDTWEIELKEGANHLGRGDGTDFKIADASVSSSHCQILVNNGDVLIQDLGSTNGTFINGQPAQNARLQNGQTIRLGNIEMIYHADVPPATEPVTASAPAINKAGAPRLRISSLNHAPEAAMPVAAEPPPLLVPQLDISAASTVCKFHPRNRASWYCDKCKRSFCDLCVNSHHNQKKCRACAVECVPLEAAADTAPSEKGFISSLPGAFIYPFRGAGVLILIFSAILFAALGSTMAGIFGILIKLGAIGYLFSYMQNIIHATAAGETHMPELPGMDDVFGGFLRLAGTVVMSFGLTLCLLVAKFNDVDIPVSVIMITILLGCLYFPMAFLVVAMKDNVLACNPLVVVPSILRVPLPYLVTVILFAGIFGFQQLGSLISAVAGSVTFSTMDMSTLIIAIIVRILWSFTSVYLLTVNMRIMGLLYVTQKEKLGWY